MSNKIFISTMFVSRNSNTTDSTGETEIAHTYWAQEWSLHCSIISFLMTVLWSGGHWFFVFFFLPLTIILSYVLLFMLLLTPLVS